MLRTIPEYVNRFWRVLRASERVMQEFPLAFYREPIDMADVSGAAVQKEGLARGKNLISKQLAPQEKTIELYIREEYIKP